MFVRNRTDLDPVLARGHLDHETAVASLSVQAFYRVTPQGELVMVADNELGPNEPPDVRGHPVWVGASITASGFVRAPAQAPFSRTVTLEVGEDRHELAIFGARRWIARPDGLTPSDPEPFDSVPLAWERAFGGCSVLEPGYLPGTQLPHPGAKLVYPLNPAGMGFYACAEAALGQPLPQVEHARGLIRSWNDYPEPAGFAPCPELAGLRLRPELLATAMASERAGSWQTNVEEVAMNALLMHHHAPRRLIRPRLDAGTAVKLQGLGPGRIAFPVPQSPVSVRWLGGARIDYEVLGRVRSLHIDAERAVVNVTFAHSHSYEVASPPAWIHVEQAA